MLVFRVGRVFLDHVVVLQHVVDLEGLRQFSSLEDEETPDFLLLLLLAPPHVHDSEACACRLAVRTVEEPLDFVVGLHFAVQLVL